MGLGDLDSDPHTYTADTITHGAISPDSSLFQCWGLNLGSHAQWAFPVALSHTSDYENIVFEQANLSPETQGKSTTGVGVGHGLEGWVSG